jgi:hypothetical protein
MPLLNKALPNLIGGVSQQPDVTRFDGQCEEQENALSSVVNGLVKRPQTKHIVELISSAISNNSFVHFINRSETEQYVYIQDGQDINIFNILTGVKCVLGTPLEELIGTYTTLYLPLDEWDTSLTGSENRDGRQVFPIYFNATQTEKDSGNLYNITTSSSTGVKGYSKVSSTEYVGRLSATSATDFGLFKVDGSNALSETGTWKSGKKNKTTAALTSLTGDFGTGTSPTLPTTVDTDYWYYEYNTTSKSDFLSSSSHYLRQSSDPRANIKAITLGDTTLLLNKTVTVAQNNIATDTISKDVVFFIKQGDYEKEYGFTFISGITGLEVKAASTSGASSTGTNGNSSTILDQIAEDIAVKRTDLKNAGFNPRSIQKVLASSGDYNNNTTHPNDVLTNFTDKNVIALKNDTYTNEILPVDDLSGNGMGVVYNSVSAITDLPLVCLNGMKIKVKGNADSGVDDFYVKFKADSIEDEGFTTTTPSSNVELMVPNVGKGSWVETVGEASSSGLDNTTLPYSLVNDNTNQFLIRPTSYASLQVGDLLSNPHPSFVGNKISNMFFFRNRLGFVSNDNIIMSESGLGVLNNANQINFNFYRTSVRSLLDSDPIDVTIAGTKVADIKSAVGFQENLILFSNNSQFVLKGGNLLTPSTVSIAPITNFETDVKVEPVALGSYIYFAFNRSSFAGIQEFTITSNTDNYNSTEITEHVPIYIPKNITHIIGSSSEDIIAVFTSSTPKVVYIYKYFWSNNKKILSSWSKFTFDFDINNMNIFEGLMYFVGTKENKTHLLTLDLQTAVTDAGATYNTLLDMRRTVVMGASGNVEPSSTNDFVRSTTSTTVVPLEYTASAGDTIEVYDDEGNKLTLTETMPLSGTATSVTLSNAHTGKVFSGLAYTMKYVFSEQVFKEAAGQSKAPSGFIKAQIRNGVVFFNNTRGFKVKVKADNRDEVSSVFTPILVGTSTIGNIDLEDGHFKFPVFTDASGTVITIENDSALPSNFSSAEFEMFVHRRSSRYG